MSTWIVMPSKRQVAEAEKVLTAWRTMGYKIALWRDWNDEPIAHLCDIVRPGEYPGYARAVNALAAEVLDVDPLCDWVVAAGDDTLPDPNKSADEIAAECSDHYSDLHHQFAEYEPPEHAEAGTHPFTAFARTLTGEQMQTFGVMQPTGDPWSDRRGKLIDRIAGSPWLGREWCLRANQGKGPLWPGFFHMWADECLQIVALQLGVFWQRPDLCHHHDHWGRPREGERIGRADRMPAFLARANSKEQTDLDFAEFNRLKTGGFKQCLPL